MNVHHNLESIKAVALHYAKEHRCNYNIILMNPGPDGEFSLLAGSTYEYVADSYFEKDRPNVKRICTTDEMQEAAKPAVKKCPKCNGTDWRMTPIGEFGHMVELCHTCYIKAITPK